MRSRRQSNFVQYKTKVQKLVEEYHRILIDTDATEVDISQGSTISILSIYLGPSKLSVRWLPKVWS